jgi:hypothetical protein
MDAKWALHTSAHVNHLTGGFMQASLGRRAFESITENPATIGAFVEPGDIIECKEVISAAEDTFEAIGWDDFDLAYDCGHNEPYVIPDHESLKRRYPELTARFGTLSLECPCDTPPSVVSNAATDDPIQERSASRKKNRTAPHET